MNRHTMSTSYLSVPATPVKADARSARSTNGALFQQLVLGAGAAQPASEPRRLVCSYPFISSCTQYNAKVYHLVADVTDMVYNGDNTKGAYLSGSGPAVNVTPEVTSTSTASLMQGNALTMNINKAFTSKFLRASDIDDIADEATQTAILTIDRVEMAEVGEDQQQKPVLYFQNVDPGLVLNKTNSATLAKLLGNETDDWEGKPIGLFTTEVDYAGKQVLAIRVRMKLPKVSKKAAVAEEETAEMPF